jgi:hypothetical protein
MGDVQGLCDALTERLGVDFASMASCITFKLTGIDALVDPAIFESSSPRSVTGRNSRMS